MSPSRPFIEPGSGGLDTDQILVETYPLAGLVLLFAGLALVPFLLALLFGGSFLSGLFTVFAQLLLAIGSGIMLMYVIARGVQLSGE